MRDQRPSRTEEGADGEPARGLPREHALRALQAPLSHRPPALRLRRAAPASCRLVLASRVIPLTLPPGTAPGGGGPGLRGPCPGKEAFLRAVTVNNAPREALTSFWTSVSLNFLRAESGSQFHESGPQPRINIL